MAVDIFTLSKKVASHYRLPSFDRDDLVQELSLVGLRLKEKPRAYIRASMRNRAVDFLRARERESRRLMPLEFAYNIPAPQEQFYLSEILDLERKAESMDAWQRKILFLISIGNSLLECSDLSGVNIKRISRLLKRVRESMEG